MFLDWIWDSEFSGSTLIGKKSWNRNLLKIAMYRQAFALNLFVPPKGRKIYLYYFFINKNSVLNTWKYETFSRVLFGGLFSR